MAAEWYYTTNGQQTGPVELAALREMFDAGSLARSELVFGPGLSQWTAMAQVPALVSGGAGVQPTARGDDYPPAGASLLAYRGVETATHGLSDVAIRALQQTKPWVRFIGIMTFIAAGLMLITGAGMTFTMVYASRGGAGAGIPVWLGGIYVVLAIVYIIPAVLLNRYASAIGRLMRSQRMSDIEQALGAQKSFWRFVGIMMIAIIGLYIVFFVVLIATKGRF